MDNALIKWGILGTSFISEVMVDAIQESKTGELIAIGSRSIEVAKRFSEKFTIPKFYDDYQSLIHDNDIDAVYIGLPNHLHKEWVIRCARAGKNILCEKPFVIGIDEIHEVTSVIEKTNIFCMEALMYRYHPFIKKLQEIIQSDIIGKIKLYNATYTANIAEIANPVAGGSIRNLGCYPISLVRLLANAEPVEIRGIGRMNCKNNTDSQASVLLKFADDSIAAVSTADDIEMHWQFEVYGTKGYLKTGTNPWLPDSEGNKIFIYLNNELTPKEINVNAEKSLYTYQIDFINEQILNGDSKQFNKTSLLDSTGNAIVLETWLKQINLLNTRQELSGLKDRVSHI
ncbi:TPA: Gfo/Idh/MocA family oxidoreductase [Legionella pneumophila]|uniref:Gfo/Idh/MocA family oxidoreductase n=1 Tax=Legionella pneumophila TaxID=446 RepID=A0A2S6EZ36_LEGPN|nr:Gfo/Idh/MocA family oxidoreductase [Legionella pneumophila]APF02970.1 oxidoreductase [Legionella pneumophila subsp. fraseri]APF06000.1 oxidoreductase [Legionella pneumophila subsp. fraseri]AUB68459.1 oxidoreductase [Legionella pneumophila]AUB71432.1 oxidoreductase [Legionella pneumophila]KXB24175.1 oxidoreductase [Legionella pneumophila]